MSTEIIHDCCEKNSTNPVTFCQSLTFCPTYRCVATLGSLFIYFKWKAAQWCAALADNPNDITQLKTSYRAVWRNS